MLAGSEIEENVEEVEVREEHPTLAPAIGDCGQSTCPVLPQYTQDGVYQTSLVRVQCSAEQYSTVQCRAVQYSAEQYSTVQYSTVCCVVRINMKMSEICVA
jgi:hypothetical protein